ncbi:hypothetical protein EDD22DRAFT_882668 [Suillus occidentalis]|nr:hypothetical protein EDD22DRAFT_882668 [Suillus occidentalis]
MPFATHQPQFTQPLLSIVYHTHLNSTSIRSSFLESQAQSGRRYTPSLARFYTSLGPGIIVQLTREFSTTLGVKHRDGPSGE